MHAQLDLHMKISERGSEWLQPVLNLRQDINFDLQEKRKIAADQHELCRENLRKGNSFYPDSWQFWMTRWIQNVVSQKNRYAMMQKIKGNRSLQCPTQGGGKEGWLWIPDCTFKLCLSTLMFHLFFTERGTSTRIFRSSQRSALWFSFDWELLNYIKGKLVTQCIHQDLWSAKQ